VEVCIPQSETGARGDFTLYSDAAMGRRVNVSGRTIRRHRKALAAQGLVEVVGHGEDHRPCMVRPVLRDGSPVFLLRPEMAGRSDTYGRRTRPVGISGLTALRSI